MRASSTRAARTSGSRLAWYSAATILLAASPVLVVTGLITGNLAMCVAGFAVFPVIIAASSIYQTGLVRRSVVGLVVPVFLLYSSLSIALAGTDTAGLQIGMLLAGSAFFALGAGLVRPRRMHDASVSLSPIQIRERLFLVVFLAGAAASCFAYATTGIPIFSANLAEDRLLAFQNGYLGTFIVTTLTVCFAIATTMAIDVPPGDRRARWIVYAALSFALLFGFGNRGLFFTPVLLVLAIQLLKHPRRIGGIALAGVALLVAVSLIGYNRDLQLFGASHLANLQASGIPADLLWLGPVIDYLRGTSTAVDLIIQTFPEHAAHPHGSVFFAALLSPLPGEQIPPGVFLKETLGMGFVGTGLASGAIGGLYMDFGLLGVLIGFAVFGVIGKLFEGASWRSPRALVLYAFVISHFWFINYAHPLPFFTTLTVPLLLFAVIRKTDPEAMPDWQHGFTELGRRA